MPIFGARRWICLPSSQSFLGFVQSSTENLLSVTVVLYIHPVLSLILQKTSGSQVSQVYMTFTPPASTILCCIPHICLIADILKQGSSLVFGKQLVGVFVISHHVQNSLFYSCTFRYPLKTDRADNHKMVFTKVCPKCKCVQHIRRAACCKCPYIFRKSSKPDYKDLNNDESDELHKASDKVRKAVKKSKQN